MKLEYKREIKETPFPYNLEIRFSLYRNSRLVYILSGDSPEFDTDTEKFLINAGFERITERGNVCCIW